MRGGRAIALGVLIAGLLGFQAGAHEFDTALVVPLSGGQAAEGTAFLQGFRVATRERDGHPDETSDGHLGGLDVQMRPVDGAAGLAAVREALAGIEAPVVVVYAAEGWRAAISRAFGDAAVIGPGVLPSAAAIAASGFAADYRIQYGEPPTAAAHAGYNAARRIDMAVRAQQGVDDRAALRSALDATAAGIDW